MPAIKVRLKFYGKEQLIRLRTVAAMMRILRRGQTALVKSPFGLYV
jgi:hypothetical protein